MYVQLDCSKAPVTQQTAEILRYCTAWYVVPWVWGMDADEFV